MVRNIVWIDAYYSNSDSIFRSFHEISEKKELRSMKLSLILTLFSINRVAGSCNDSSMDRIYKF